MGAISPLTSLEIASGLVLGTVGTEPLPEEGKGLAPLDALERAMLPALSRPPCLVSFSGGRDSSAVLAVATAVARRQGLPTPVPITLRFTDAPASEEAEWQEMVIRALGIGDWIRLQVSDELDLLGPVGGAAVRRHGVLWPPNVYLHAPLFDQASGGSVMTGVDGDGLFGGWKWTRLSQLARRHVHPAPRDLLRLGMACSPLAVRVRVIQRRHREELFWLQPAAKTETLEAWARHEASEPLRWDKRLSWLARRRHLRLAFRFFDLLAADSNTTVHHPLADPLFLSSLAAAGGVRGYGNRTYAMHSMFHDLLPAATIQRPTKAIFSEPIYRDRTLAFARSWDGTGVDADIVDVDRLRQHWSSGFPHFSTMMLLQQAWLSQQRSGKARLPAGAKRPSHP